MVWRGAWTKIDNGATKWPQIGKTVSLDDIERKFFLHKTAKFMPLDALNIYVITASNYNRDSDTAHTLSSDSQ